MAKKAAAKTAKLAGQTVAFVGKFGYGSGAIDSEKELVKDEGGTVVDPEQTLPDYLVAGKGVGGNPPAVIAKLQKKHPQLQAIDIRAFYQLINPTADEFQQLMLSGNLDHDFWYKLRSRLDAAGVTLDLSGRDFRNQWVVGTLYKVCLDDCDFRGCTIEAHFDKIKNSKFDGCKFNEGSFNNAEDCSLQNVTMEETRWNPAVFTRCDFTGAKLNIRIGMYTVAKDCIFHKADCSGSHLERSRFVSADFSEANLANVDFETTDLTRANLAGANLTGANLRNANLQQANLSGANLTKALLIGALLSGATIDGADFTGAQLTGADLTGLDLSVAINLEQRPPRVAGPNLTRLLQAARQATKFQTSLEMELGPDEYVVLQPNVATYGGRAYISEACEHVAQGKSRHQQQSAPSLERAILNLTDLWSRGRPKFETVKVSASKCPLKGKELQDLAVAAWYEACGVEMPSAEELAAAQQQAAAGKASLREAMLAELHGGEQGVAQWNARSEAERKNLGKLRKHDFTKAKLAGVQFSGHDFEGCIFDRADLKEAHMENCQFKGANFASANLPKAWLAGGKYPEASFAGANLKDCNLRNANFRRTNFQNADLTGADFSYSELFGADFTGATLKRVEFHKTKFDEKTIFPPNFDYPAGLEWKGAGLRPGTAAPPPPPPSGSLDFEAFIARLNLNVEKARLDKAASMLKKESFQLFAEVKDDSLGGIVKSQTDADLVYSCRLTSSGAFGCCTQNLRPCGGLRGALCKHLLVLIIGLAKAGQLDSATVDHWIELSQATKPAIDEDAMSATFLKYKGAEAGELDWRPTETIPEDFYSM